ncbi:class I SAM-dependent methyltransferase [Cognatishimia sp.]|uniref:class I SAM-dependent methyltransferase n=1 Tax=Cognatishimia sp. TaxID=2211648 RepID=UPI003517AF08
MADPETIKTYSTQVEKYQKVAMTDAESRALGQFLAHLEQGAHILDLGCGPGHHSEQMLAAGFQVAAIDATPEFVETARARGVDARLGLFDDLTEVAAYDAIWASFSLLHAPRADFPRHLDAIHKALRTKGHLYLGLKLGEGEKRDSIGRFYAYFQEDELRDHLAARDFAIKDWTVGEGAGLSGEVHPFVLITAQRTT